MRGLSRWQAARDATILAAGFVALTPGPRDAQSIATSPTHGRDGAPVP